jgi:hypothetical protein
VNNILAHPSAVKALHRQRQEAPEKLLLAAYLDLAGDVALAAQQVGMSAEGIAVWKDALTFAAAERGAGQMMRASGFRYTSYLSRFRRAGLPSPAYILRAIRSYYVVALYRAGIRRSQLAYLVGASSPQSLSRTMRREFGMPSAQLAARFTTDERRRWIIAHLIEPYGERWSTFRLPVPAPWRAVTA